VAGVGIALRVSRRILTAVVRINQQIVLLVYHNCCVPQASDRELVRVLESVTGACINYIRQISSV
jgi:hypothetical protein